MMSSSQEDLLADNPKRAVLNRRRNRVSSPPNQSPQNTNKPEVFELFTIKPQKDAPQPTPRRRNSKISTSDSQDTSKISDDVFVKPVSVSTPSRSYRDKINERFKTMKERAGMSSKKANVFRETAEKILLDKVRRESNDVEAELQAIRNKFKLGKMPQNNEMYEFFCLEKDSELASPDNEDGTKSTENLTNSDPIQSYTPSRSEKVLLSNSEHELFFKPRAVPVSIEDKIDEEARNFADEGLYVPEKPNISTQYLNLIEQRLSRDSKQVHQSMSYYFVKNLILLHRKWFDSEGKLKTVENPVRKTSFRPELHPLSSYETTIYLQAAIANEECDEVVIVKENILQLQISTLKFIHHPLFSVEHVFAAKLKSLYLDYERCASNNTLTILNRKVEALRQILRKIEDSSSQSGDHSDKEEEKSEVYRRDIKKLQEMLFQEGKKGRDRMKQILETWKNIKKIREKNTFSNTTIKLMIVKHKADYAQEKEDFDRKFEELYDEVLLEQRLKRRKNRKQRSIDEDEIRQDLLIRFQESFKPPGEPIIHFSLTEDNEITKNVDDSKELMRRNAVKSTKVALKIICNKLEVCKTKSVPLNQDFTCNFNETISILLINVPKCFTIEIIEQPKALVKKISGELVLKIPPRHVIKDNKKTMNERFEKNEIVHYKHAGVGSGIKIGSLLDNVDIDTIEDIEITTAGLLNYSIAWDNVSFNDESKINADANEIIDDIVDKTGGIDLEKLSEWLQQNKPDPQDPKNSVFFEYTLGGNDETFPISHDKKYFRLNPYMKSLQFCDVSVLEDNLRLKLLQLRDRNEPEFDRMAIPNRIKEIPLNILDDYKRRIAAEREGFQLDEDDDEDEMEKRRSRGRKYLKQVHIKVFQKCKNSANNLTFDDVLDEKFLTQFQKIVENFVGNFINWFRWRPLQLHLPTVRHTSQESKLHEHLNASQTKITFKIISAINIPERLEGEVRPFVEVEYNNIVARTSTSRGVTPQWNEELFLPLESAHVDYLNPKSLNGTISVNLYDENEVVLTKFGGIVKGRNWLGCLEISLSTISYSPLHGMVRIKIPHILFGYKEKQRDKQAKSPRSNSIQPDRQTYINIIVEIEPSIPKLSPSIEELPCSEVPYLKDHALKWNENYNLNYPSRKFSVFAIDSNATTTCIVRYIRPLEPPQINVEGFDVTPEQCARFVSLIPFTDCNQFYQNIWLSVDQFLHLMIGSIIDHAIALTCYLLALKLEAWLLLGFGVPYGSTAFVLVKEYDGNQMANYYIFDVVHGEKRSLNDVFCPLLKVYCVVNEQNIWANIQNNDNISLTRFDFTRKSDWLPMFDSQVTVPTNSVHGKISYSTIADVDEFEMALERNLRKKFAKLRQLDRTIWNHNISNGVKRILNLFEHGEMYGKNDSEAMIRLGEIFSSYEVKGHVMCIPFISMKDVMTRVKVLGIHLEEDSRVQFASAIFLKSYSNQVLAVWLFVASVVEKSF